MYRFIYGFGDSFDLTSGSPTKSLIHNLFSGEIALLDASKKRSANVIALDRVKCMTLSKADFGILLKGVRSVMVQLRKASTLTDLAALREAADEDDENIKKEKKENSIYSIRANVKPVSFLSSNGVKCSGRVRMLFKTMAKFMSQSLSTTLYGRMYRTMLSNPLKIQEYGQKAVKIMLDDHNNKYRGTINEIRLQCRTILEKEVSFRSVVENVFIFGVMDQCHGLKDFLTKGWLPDQFNDLCKTLKILRVKPMDRVRQG